MADSVGFHTAHRHPLLFVCIGLEGVAEIENQVQVIGCNVTVIGRRPPVALNFYHIEVPVIKPFTSAKCCKVIRVCGVCIGTVPMRSPGFF